jgi:hypothetical protein
MGASRSDADRRGAARIASAFSTAGGMMANTDERVDELERRLLELREFL